MDHTMKTFILICPQPEAQRASDIRGAGVCDSVAVSELDFQDHAWCMGM